jgi:hypothetical protein
MTTKRTGFSGVFSLLFWVLRSCGAGLRRGASAVWRGFYQFVLISGQNPSLTRDPGIAAYRMLEGHPRRSRPFRESAVATAPGVANEPHLQFSAFL